jgi:hypothetical protein
VDRINALQWASLALPLFDLREVVRQGLAVAEQSAAQAPHRTSILGCDLATPHGSECVLHVLERLLHVIEELDLGHHVRLPEGDPLYEYEMARSAARAPKYKSPYWLRHLEPLQARNALNVNDLALRARNGGPMQFLSRDWTALVET